MARTNKMGILKKKQQQAKQKTLGGSKVRSTDGMKRAYTNPLGHEYEWFMRSGKWICDVTTGREDPDGWRIRRQPSGGEPEFVFQGDASWAYRRRRRRNFRQNRKK